jgi:osmoprotectant transport system ATP-binding protein
VADAAARIVFDHVTKRYPGRAAPAVDDLTLDVPAGEICVLVGPSGGGKTTAMKMVNRLIDMTEGDILIGEQSVRDRDVTELRRGIGYVIQQTGLFPHQTIGENVATVPRLLGWPKARRQERADELLDTVGLDPAAYASRYPAQLSGGERQRVGVARALAADPPIMLMDEPFGAVDPIVRERLQNEFLRIQERLAKTILFVTHDIDEAIKMGDVVAVFRDGGVVEQFATPAEILAAPASDFVARFVGADRGLKRLSLMRVNDIPLGDAVTAQVGGDAAEARRRVLANPFRFLLLLDANGAPIGWIDQEHVPASGTLHADLVDSTSPLLDRRTTLKDALSMLLDDLVQAGVVVDRRGAFRGLITIEAVMQLMRETAADADPSATAHDRAPAASGLPGDAAPDARG